MLQAIAALMLSSCATSPAPVSTVQLYSAGSLRDALSEVAKLYEAQGGDRVAATFGASGLLRERIEKGEPAQVFTSADMEHPQRLAQGPAWQAPVVFARNQMCLLAAPSVPVNSANVLETLLQPSVRVGTSTPRADPSGDYAWAVFRRADTVRPGAYAALDAKALKLTGGPGLPQPPAGRNTYAWLMEEGKADVFLTYCTGAVAVQREMPQLKVVQLPAE
ncbi:MAG: molybdate ABC transporter substrate-binding protein, partial [Ramlibacter sp.]